MNKMNLQIHSASIPLCFHVRLLYFLKKSHPMISKRSVLKMGMERALLGLSMQEGWGCFLD